MAKKRKDIQVSTLNKIKDFLKEQLEPIYKSEIVTQLRIDYDSLKIALTMIPHKIDKKGRVKSK